MKKISIIVAICALIILIFGSIVFVFQTEEEYVEDEKLSESDSVNDFSENNEEEDEGSLEQKNELEEEDEIEEKVEVTSATIAGVGDVLIHRSLYYDAYVEGEYNFKPMLENTKPYISQADIGFANQETMLGGVELGLSDYPLFNSPTEVGDALQYIGIDVVSIANNHTLDVGEQGVLNAIDYYDSVGMVYTGGYRSAEDRLEIRTIEANGIIFSFLAYSYGTNGIPVPDGKEYLVNLIDREQINEDIIAAKEVSDVVVLSLHFGNEYEPMPNENQKSLANEFAQTGADIIFGHHPHVLQPMEWIEQEDGRRTFVAYSLGNFISGQEGVEREIGGIAQLEVKKTTKGEEVTIELGDPRFVPVFTYKHNWRNYKLHILEDIGDDVLMNAQQHYENTKEHVAQWMPELRFDFD
ncbi:CapA family protein [Evansella sp. AB-P1]|uniref:CapA family protein n=1 Tax=Evansella sp. AB-P1 TaxID=3037653 RepID=UPI00241D9B12|nr:CapA family protein [Evansella sp. AB-P1]MDG5787851.1 CapA family protein [Evansella sp. AB-P1]